MLLPSGHVDDEQVLLQIFNCGDRKGIIVLELGKNSAGQRIKLNYRITSRDPVISKLFGQTLRWPTGNLDGKLSVPRKKPWLMPGLGIAHQRKKDGT
jgi:hypothetical protein